MIDGYDRFIDLQTAISSKKAKVDMTKAHQVAREPFATATMRGIQLALSAGFVQTGKAVYTSSSVTVVGKKATIKTCLDQSRMKLVNRRDPSAPRWEARPPSKATVLLAHQGDSWLVTGYKGDEGACVSG